MNKITKEKWGFTFIEVLVVIVLIGAIAGLAIPFYQSFQVTSQLDNYMHDLVGTLRQAQARSMASKNLSSWGVYLASDKFVLFQGDIYSPGEATNEEHSFPGTITLSPDLGNIVVFEAISGITANTGQMTMSATDGSMKLITINQQGVVDAY